MSKSNAKANPVNKDSGNHNQGAEPGQDQLPARRNRQNTGAGPGTVNQSVNQGRQRGAGQARDSRLEKGDSRRSRKR